MASKRRHARSKLRLHERSFGDRLTALTRLHVAFRVRQELLDRALAIEDEIYRLVQKVHTLRDQRQALIDRFSDCQTVVQLAARLFDDAHEPVREWSNAEQEREAA